MAKRRADPGDDQSSPTSAIETIKTIVENHDDPELMKFMLNRYRIEIGEAKRRGRPRKTEPNSKAVEIAIYAAASSRAEAAAHYNITERYVADCETLARRLINGAN
jgi:hypothetical protein